MVTGREEVLPIELLEKHTEWGEREFISFPLCPGWALMPFTYASLKSTPLEGFNDLTET